MWRALPLDELPMNSIALDAGSMGQTVAIAARGRLGLRATVVLRTV